MPTDPVCGMFVPEGSELFSIIDGQKYYFCSKSCKQKYSSPEKESQKLKKKLAVGWSLSIPIIVITYAVPGAWLSGEFYRNLLLLVLVLPVQFYSGFSFYEGAYHAIKGRSGNMDLLISLGTLTAFVFSVYVTFVPGQIPGSDVFYDASAFIITLILTGNLIENLTKVRANRAAGKLIDLIPGTAHFISPEGEAKDIKTDEVKAGDSILVRPGEIFPADGEVYDGKSEVDESMLTGEQEPVLKSEGSTVSSGTKNLNGVLKLVVTKTGKDSTVNLIYELIQRAISGRAKVQKIADVFSSVFVPIVLIAAVSSGLFWYFYLSTSGFALAPEIAVLAFVSVVVIACPCAIGLAGPITLLISSNVASEDGIIIKNTGALDRLSRITRAVFDKTGTLTDPDPAISGISAEEGFTADEVLSLAASVESNSNHPIASAIVVELKNRKMEAESASDIEEIPGTGITGKVGGRNVRVSRASRKGGSMVSVEVDGKLAGHIELVYRIRESSAFAIKRLREMGIRTTMITGDSKAEAERIAAQLGIEDIHAEVLPADKSEIIKDYQMKGDYVMFTGDGINDTVALETADVGIAMGSGTDIARESGDLILLRNDLSQIIYAKHIGDRTIAKVKQNIAWAIGYNSALIPVAAGVLVPVFGLSIYSFLPLLAAFAMGMSSSSVVINSLLLRPRLTSILKSIRSSVNVQRSATASMEPKTEAA